MTTATCSDVGMDNTRTPSPETPVSGDGTLAGATTPQSVAALSGFAANAGSGAGGSQDGPPEGTPEKRGSSPLPGATPSGDVSSLIERVARAIAPNSWARKDAGGHGVSLEQEVAKSLSDARAAIAAYNTEAAIVLKRYREALERARPYVANLINLGEMEPRYPNEAALERHKAILAEIDAALKAGA
jgi:hypothetical protein